MDEDYMKLAIGLAKNGKGKVSPNPMVGAIIVKGKKIIGRGYHEHYGGSHAEVRAFENASEDVGGSTLNFSALKQSVVDKVQVYIAPKIIGGDNIKGKRG